MKHSIFSFSSVTSTNDIAKKLLETRNNVIVTAKFQSKGRGRNNKQWVGDESKNIYLSIANEHTTINQEINLLMLGYQCIGCLAVVISLEKKFLHNNFALKYPNDVYAQEKDGVFKKISGVLVENEFIGNIIKSSILGIGVNITQSDFAVGITATSLYILGLTTNQDELLRQIIFEVNRLLQMPFQELIDCWKLKLNIKNKSITIIGEEGEWFANEFNDFGMLVVERNGMKITISNGDSIRYKIE